MIAANWRIECNVECPYCDEYIDLLTVQDSFEWLPAPGVSDKIDVEIECPKCSRNFTVQETTY